MSKKIYLTGNIFCKLFFENDQIIEIELNISHEKHEQTFGKIFASNNLPQNIVKIKLHWKKTSFSVFAFSARISIDSISVVDLSNYR